MNKKIFLLLAVASLTSCAKTKLLYSGDAYASPVFDENYYVDWDDIKSKKIINDTDMLYSNLISEHNSINLVNGPTNYNPEGYVWDGVKEDQFGYHNNLSSIEKKFSYGITSKLFDGRVRCEGLYQKSRVQLDKSGFAMYFPKSLVSAKYLGFACRGGTDYPSGEEFSHNDLLVDFKWSFYLHINNSDDYNKITYTLRDVKIPVDNGGNTSFVHFMPYMGNTFDELNGAVAMSFEWSCVDPRMQAERPNLTDDYTEKEKHHLSLMLYEVFIGQSEWY